MRDKLFCAKISLVPRAVCKFAAAFMRPYMKRILKSGYNFQYCNVLYAL